jgi:hypothetical protein
MIELLDMKLIDLETIVISQKKSIHFIPYSLVLTLDNTSSLCCITLLRSFIVRLINLIPQ